MNEQAATKRSLRMSAGAARRGLSPTERREQSAAAVERLGSLPELRWCSAVLLYAATAEELDPSGLLATLRRRGVRTLYPRVRDDRLELALVRDTSRLTSGFRGIPEPVGPAADPGMVDAALVPGLAFAPDGTRLGRGGGHYDRLLARLDDVTTIGLCFSCQMVPRIPREDHDVPVDVVITERAVYRPRHEPPRGA